MSEEKFQKPLVKSKNEVSKIWVLPVITLVVGISLVVSNWLNKGVKIQLYVESAEGIQSEKTKVKLKDVNVGVVKSVSFNESSTDVVLTLEIKKEISHFINKETKFWVEKPRVSSGQISGLGTIFSGNHIAFMPGKSDKKKTEFIALSAPPINMKIENGKRISLLSKENKSLNVGSKVFYRGFIAGKVEGVNYDMQNDRVIYQVFIKSPYSELIREESLFWNAGGLSIQTQQQGFKLSFTSVDAIFSGAIEFMTPKESLLKLKNNKIREFRLYKNKDDMENRSINEFIEVIAFFETSVSGLSPGAPVEYRGLRVGTVGQSLSMSKITELRKKEGLKDDGSIGVVLKIEPSRFMDNFKPEDTQEFKQYLKKSILDGLKASIIPSNLLTGTMKVTLNRTTDKPNRVRNVGHYIMIPTQSVQLTKLAESATKMFNKFSSMPLNETFKDIQDVLRGLKPDSSGYKNIERTLVKIQTTMDELTPVLKKLNDKPNSLIFGSSGKEDILPRAKGRR